MLKRNDERILRIVKLGVVVEIQDETTLRLSREGWESELHEKNFNKLTNRAALIAQDWYIIDKLKSRLIGWTFTSEEGSIGWQYDGLEGISNNWGVLDNIDPLVHQITKEILEDFRKKSDRRRNLETQRLA